MAKEVEGEINDVAWMVLAIMISFPLIIFGIICQNMSNDIRELGQSICEKEYGMDFKSYYTEEGLTCKESKKEEVVIDYNGLEIILEKNK